MNTQTQEALHKALKVLNCLNNDRVYETAWVKGAINACEKALASNSEALAQPAQDFFERGKEIAKWADKRNEQPAQEPVAWLSTNSIANEVIKSCSAPSWQGLSNKEVMQLILINELDSSGDIGFYNLIEQALKEKNHVI